MFDLDVCQDQLIKRNNFNKVMFLNTSVLFEVED